MADNIQKLEAEMEAERPFNAGDPIEVNKARKRASRKNSERLRVIQALMQHEDGRKWIYGLLERCHIYGNPIVPNDPYLTYANLGEANVGKFIMSDVVAAAPEEYLQMCKEARESK